MKKWLLAIICSLVIANTVQAKYKIAFINMNDLFQQIAQRTGIFIKLENEFQVRANELQNMEYDIQNKMQLLQREAPIMKTGERNKLEEDVMSQRQNFSQKVQIFEQDRQRRSDEERSKLITYIQNAVKKVAVYEGIDLVIDTNAIVFNSSDIKDITNDVIKQVK